MVMDVEVKVKMAKMTKRHLTLETGKALHDGHLKHLEERECGESCENGPI